MKRILFAFVVVAFMAALPGSEAAEKKILLVAGNPSHGPGAHEFNAGTLLLEQCLDQIDGIEAVVYKGGWPDDPNAFEDAAAVLLFMDGGSGHPILRDERLELMDKLMDRGVGLMCAHYAVEVPAGKAGDAFLKWIGGYYEHAFSTNPHWEADFMKLPEHPITRGVSPFKIQDEWYFNMRFRPEMEGVTPILVAKPSDETREGKSSWPRGPYPHIVAASGRDEILMWAVERAGGGRGVGFTGGHFHRNWGDENFRKIVLNALLWIAKVEVPEQGVKSTVSAADLEKNLDPKERNR